MSKVELESIEQLTKSELLEIGHRLSEEQLKNIGAYEFVCEAEFEYMWKLRAASELIEEFKKNRK